MAGIFIISCISNFRLCANSHLYITPSNILQVQPYEPGREKTCFFAYMRKQRRRSVTAQLISAFVFATQKVQSIYLLNPKFQAHNDLLWLYSLVGNREDKFCRDAAHIALSSKILIGSIWVIKLKIFLY